MVRVSGLRLGVVAVLALCGVASSCGITERNEEQARDLSGASLTVVADEVWVHGGLSAPVGTSPPVTSPIPPGWVPNRAVTVFGTDGKVSRTFELPGEEGRPLFGGRVFASGGAHYLLGTLCESMMMGCGSSVDPVLYRLADAGVETIPLELPPPDADGSGGELPVLYVLGHTGGTAWALQQIGSGTNVSQADLPYRLLAVDLASGAVTEVPHEGVRRPEWMCVGGDRLFLVTATLDEAGRPGETRVLSRPATAEPAPWELLTAVTFEAPPTTSFGTLTCLTDQDRLLVAHGLPDTQLITIAMNDGRETEARSSLPGYATQYLGTVNSTAIVASLAAAPVLWHHPPTGPWQVIPDTELDRRSYPIVLDNNLYDAQDLAEQSGVSDAELVPIGM